MKTYTSFFFLLTIISLFGCNTLVTKPNSGDTGIVHHKVGDHATREMLKTDSSVQSYRIDDASTQIVYANAHSSKQLQTSWGFEGENPKNQVIASGSLPNRSLNKTPLEQKSQTLSVTTTERFVSKMPQASQSRLVKTSLASKAAQPLRKSVASPAKSTESVTQKTLAKAKVGDQPPQKSRSISQSKARKSVTKKRVQKTRKIRQTKKRVQKTRRGPIKAKLTKPKLDADQTITKILADITLDAKSPKTTQKSRIIGKKNNLWTRIRNGYQLAEIENTQIQKELRKFQSNPAYFKRMAKNASPYLYHIVQEIEKRAMPLEIALLPAIESTFEPLALSHKSAAGLWQFMPATGKEYGLAQNEWYDGRRDISASTNAALTYLQKLHRMFAKDWALALAAYNYGPGNINKAISRNKAQQRPTDFWSLDLPRETRQYVPKLLALAKIVGNPNEFGLKLQPIANQAYWKQIKIGHQIKLSLAAKLANLSLKELKRLNAGYRRGVTVPEGPYNITLPIEKVSQFKQDLAKIPTHLILAQVENKDFEKAKLDQMLQLAKASQNSVAKPAVQKEVIQKYKVSNGDTLWNLAKRYGTTVSFLRELNNFSKNNTLKRGIFLKVPTTLAVGQKSREKTTKTQLHTVKSGESLWEIARRYQVSVKKLSQWNDLQTESLQKGQKLKIYLEG
jgi:membrane-bound lytic murein transglycosylase D